VELVYVHSGRGSEVSGLDDEFIASGDEPFEAILIKRRLYDEQHTPNLQLRDVAILKNGPQCYREAKHHVVVDHATGELHHHSVTIDTYKHTKRAWTFQRPRQLTITDQDNDEIARLQMFLGVVRHGIPMEDGDYLVLRVDDGISAAGARDLFDAISSDDQALLLAQALATAGGDPEKLKSLAQAALEEPEAATSAAAALNLARFSGALAELRRLIVEDAKEDAIQAHLAQHAWLFGSEYSTLLGRRRWTRDEQQDFMLRRTVDEYIELVEIKRPLNATALFRYDDSHDAYFPGPELSCVHGQVMKYLQRLDDDRLRIKEIDGEDANKIRAKIIIGRDGDADQQEALRRYNGHQHRIEVITFDQLVRIGERVLQHLQQVVDPFN
jgi:hypothetical protein